MSSVSITAGAEPIVSYSRRFRRCNAPCGLDAISIVCFSAELQLALFYADTTPYGIAFVEGKLGDNLQRQINVTDNLSLIIGAHQLKFGLDYRRLTPEAELVPYTVQYFFLSLVERSGQQGAQAFIASRSSRYATGVLQLEPVRPGHMEERRAP